MADPRVGAFGAVALVLVLALRTTAMAAVAARPLVVVGLWCGSRTLMAVAARALPYARADDGGTATAFMGGARDRAPARRLAVAAYGMGAAVACAVVGAGTRGLVVIGAEVVGMALVMGLALRRIGGYTGDVLGAGGVIGETIGLMVLVAR
jgi:adenosylcobinamide-GDP ribazoletransferase